MRKATRRSVKIEDGFGSLFHATVDSFVLETSGLAGD